MNQIRKAIVMLAQAGYSDKEIVLGIDVSIATVKRARGEAGLLKRSRITLRRTMIRNDPKKHLTKSR